MAEIGNVGEQKLLREITKMITIGVALLGCIELQKSILSQEAKDDF